jgi:predicted XRE-type DNA-binding protein
VGRVRESAQRLIADRERTQSAAAKQIGIKQPDLSNILRGNLRGHLVEKLMRLLTAFEQDVEITVKLHRIRGEVGRITFIPASQVGSNGRSRLP